MRIQKLALTNFRSHAHTEFALDRVNIVRGVNGAGKSSVQDALEFLFTGLTRQTDQGGRGADLLIAHGQKQLAVSAVIFDPEIGAQDACDIERTRNHASGTLILQPPDFQTPVLGKHAEAWIAEYIAPLPVLQAVLNSGRFLALPEKEQRSLLTSALASKPVDVTPDLLAAIGKTFPAANADKFRLIADSAMADAVYNSAYDARTDLNRQLKALGELTQPTITPDLPAPATVRSQLDALHKERDVLVASIARQTSEHQANLRRLKTAREQIARFEPDMLNDADLERFRKIGDTRYIVQAENLDARITTLQANVRALEQQLAAPGNCQACNRPLERALSVDEVKTALAKARTDLGKEQEKRLKLGDPALAVQKLDAHKKAMTATGSAERDVRELQGMKETLDTSDLQSQLATLDQRIAKGNGVLSEVQRLDGEQAQYRQTADKKQSLAQQVMQAEKVIQAFAPGGSIRAQLVGDRLDPFKQRLNACLERFGFACNFTLEPYAFQITRSPDHPITGSLLLKQLSESEAFRFSLAFQVALAEATGVNFVVIDRADILLSALRSDLVELLLESKLDQAIVLVAGEPSRTFPPPEVKMFDLQKDDHGHTQIVGEYGNTVAETTVYEEIPQ